MRALHISKNGDDTARSHEASSESTTSRKRQEDGGGWNLYSWESEITSLISIKECKDSSPPTASSIENVTWLLLSSTFFIRPSLPSHLFSPQRSFELGKHISLASSCLLLHVTRAQLLTQHILGESPPSPFLNSRCIRLSWHTRASTVDGRTLGERLTEKLLA